jgi:hypothetical protein
MGDAAEAHARIATHETRGKVLLATHALVSGQIVIKEEPLIIVPPSRRHESTNIPTLKNSHRTLPDPTDLMQAFYNQNQSTQDAILDLHSPTDGRAAERYRAHFRLVLNESKSRTSRIMESVEESFNESVEEEEFVKASLFVLVVCATSTFNFGR